MLIVIVQLGHAKRCRLPHVWVAVPQEVSNLWDCRVNELLDVDIRQGAEGEGPD